MLELLIWKRNDKFSNKLISSTFLGQEGRGPTELGSLTLSSLNLASLLRVQAVVGRSEVVLAQDDLLEIVRHTVGCCENMTGGDEDPGTAPDSHKVFHYKAGSGPGSQLTRLAQNISGAPSRASPLARSPLPQLCES